MINVYVLQEFLYFYFSFNKSLISTSNSSLVGPFGGSGCFSSSSFFFNVANLFINLTAIKIEKALDYMREHDNYTIPQLAEMCNMSRSGFYNIFKKVVGCTPIQTKHRFQAHKAEILLKTTDLSVDEIAEKVGFQSTAHFRKVFYSRYHCSPYEIRKRQALK